MGATTRTSMGIGGVRALNQPQPIVVEVDDRDIPLRVEWGERMQAVAHLHDLWRVEDGWWRPEVERVRRLYFELSLAGGALLIIYHDLLRDSWYVQRA